jgi:hypothetical protein
LNYVSHALKALDEAGIKWTAVFVGGGTGTVGAAVMAGMSAARNRRRKPFRTTATRSDRNRYFYTRVRDPSMKEAIRNFAASLRGVSTLF